VGADGLHGGGTNSAHSTAAPSCFDGVGAGMAVEYTPLGAIPSIADGMEAVRAASRGGRAGLMIDSWHFGFSDNTWEDLAAVPVDDIAYLAVHPMRWSPSIGTA